MQNLEKMADLFENAIISTENGDVFGKVSYSDEAKHLALLAGKIRHKAEKEQDKTIAGKLAEVAKLILVASDMIRKI